MAKLPETEDQVLTVSNFEDLISTSFQGNKNAICWSRNLVGDFSEIVKKLDLRENVTVIKEQELLELQLSEQGQLACDVLLNDLKLLTDGGASPILNLIESYDKDDSYPFFPTDVYSFHVDRSPIPVSTFLCTYHGKPSEMLPNSEAEQKVLVPEIRNELKKLYDGPVEGFEAFLAEYFFDLHYQAKTSANPINLGRGHIWKLAVDHPTSQVLPCVHRAPIEKDGEKRLLLIC